MTWNEKEEKENQKGKEDKRGLSSISQDIHQNYQYDHQFSVMVV
jgi:hypothetical protein